MVCVGDISNIGNGGIIDQLISGGHHLVGMRAEVSFIFTGSSRGGSLQNQPKSTVDDQIPQNWFHGKI